ncbi:MAG: glycoside hydrolase family 88 protein [Tidjanibacter sp.]|nr:glycoside hydrolase family 88 protein [Tidjanibacter sp.]
MKKIRLLFLLLSLSVGSVVAQELPSRDKILEVTKRVNEYLMTKKYPDPTAVMPYYSRNKVYESNIWTRAVYYEGLMALYSIYPDNRYYDYAMRWAEFHKWGMRGDDTTTRNADNYCCAQTYIDLYRLTPRPEMLTKTIALCDMLVNSPQIEDWTWIDAIQMGMPVLVKLGTLKGDSRYYEKAYDMYMWSRNTHAGGLYNEAEGLWWRDKDFIPPYKEPNGEDCYWSRGNGWVVAALVRVLDELPQDAPHRNQYIKDLRAMCKAAKACQREDGYWNVSLHDESNFGGKEVSGTSLFIYGMAWGINNGILDREEYLPVVAKAWNTMVKEAVHKNGFLGYVQGTGKEPKDGQPVTFKSKPDFEDYGVGCFLLAGSEIYKL